MIDLQVQRWPLSVQNANEVRNDSDRYFQAASRCCGQAQRAALVRLRRHYDGLIK